MTTQYSPRAQATADRIHARGKDGFADLVRRLRTTPQGQEAMEVAEIAKGIEVGVLRALAVAHTRADVHHIFAAMSETIAYAAWHAAYPDAPKPPDLSGYTAHEGGEGI